MITIDQDVLCKSCDRDSSRCEGSSCDETRESYIEEHGIVEDECEPNAFGDLQYGDIVYRICDGELSERKIQTVKHDSDGLRIEVERMGWEHVKIEKVAMPEKGLFVKKQHAITAYTNLMHNTMKRMMQKIIDFEKA